MKLGTINLQNCQGPFLEINHVSGKKRGFLGTLSCFFLVFLLLSRAKYLLKHFMTKENTNRGLTSSMYSANIEYEVCNPFHRFEIQILNH